MAAEARARGLECVGSKVAHELKNPLSAVKGLVQLLARSAADDRSRERLGVIAGEVTRMEGILRDYLTFARPLTDLSPEPVELGPLADEVLAVLEARSEAARVTLRCKGGPVVADGDPRRLKEALLNLVANALEATPAGGSVEVEVSGDPDGASSACATRARGMSPRTCSGSARPSSPRARAARASAWSSPARPSASTAAMCASRARWAAARSATCGSPPARRRRRSPRPRPRMPGPEAEAAAHG